MRALLIAARGLVVPLLLCCRSQVHGPPAEVPKIEIEIVDAKTGEVRENRGRAYGIFWIDVAFTNVGEGVATVIKPQDGSWEGWLSPVYDLTIQREGDAKPMSSGGRCGNHGATYDHRSMIRIAPGDTETQSLPVALSPDEPGVYRLKLRYEVRPGAYPGPRYRAPSDEEYEFADWPDGVFTGTATSNEFTLTLR
jgi:hypothetical protein